ncbi:MAG TPA: CpaD family pilus assembly protein [Xanthobacteraceae bacterium]|nr:CpaD family pilus assembly protein [Xanthobacteraceae bacterium]
MTRAVPATTVRPSPAALARVAFVVVAAALTSGCLASASQEMTNTIPTDYRERHPISIREGEEALEVFVGTRRAQLMPAQRAEIAAFARTWRREATGGIAIELPVGTSNARAAAGVAHEIRSVLASAGVPGQAVVTRKYEPSDPTKLATVRLVYPKMVAEAGPCGLWPNDLGPTSDPFYNQNGTYWNLGCAHQRNLAAMVANPADLVQPRSAAPIYTARRNTVLDKYRKGESTATIDQNAEKGKISDVGK